ncbi:MAG TPA: efflux transporter outer membrane subunit [Candidatus Dormibacteraeota bacterium]|jgi:NodT family efflux transporter outer membrane factor (OMF) lipoprotein|nr:efflux transporter outer membrane subunit [Candidatus Dormibacteraeota bacterium]
MKLSRKMTFSENPQVRLMLLALTLGVTGCAVGPKYRPPVIEAPPGYKEVGDWKPAQPNDQNLGGDWWTVFQDPQLDALEQQINVGNQNLKAAEAQFQQARAAVRYNRADYYPTVTAGPSATRTRISGNSPTSSILRGATYNDFVLPVDVSYQADVWGRVRKNVESYREQAQASAADLATINLSMHADLAIDYFQARSLDAEEQLLNSTVTQYEQALQLTQSRFEGGIASEVEVEQAKTQLQTTRAAAIDVGVARAQFEHAVAILIGKPPAEFSLPPLPLTAPPPHIPVSVPSELLERRPDIAAAERRVASANAQIGVAKSAYYPTISLGASGGFESSSITTLLNGPSGLWSFGLSAVGTLFDGGRRHALTDQARAAYDFQVSTYRQSVLSGFQQVEDNLAAVRILENEAKVQNEAVIAAQNSLNLSITRYKGGVTSYLEVITAQSAALTDEVTAVNILGRRMANTVLLIQALGGGWDRSSLPERPECCGKLASSSGN